MNVRIFGTQNGALTQLRITRVVHAASVVVGALRQQRLVAAAARQIPAATRGSIPLTRIPTSAQIPLRLKSHVVGSVRVRACVCA